MLHPSTQKLIDRLAEMTERGKLDWTEHEEQGLIYVTEGYSVLLAGSPAELVIMSNEGKELERASAQELADTPFDTQGTYATVIAALVKAASRIARGTETAINSLLADIEQTAEEPVLADVDAPETEAPEAVIEDIVDDTTVTSEELSDQADTIDAQNTNPADAAETTSSAAMTEVSDPAMPPHEETDIADMSDNSDTEPDMREAVARLAGEVNGSGSATAKDGDASHTYVPFGLATAMAAADITPEPESPVEETIEDTASVELDPVTDLSPSVEMAADEEAPIEAVELASEEMATPDPVESVAAETFEAPPPEPEIAPEPVPEMADEVMATAEPIADTSIDAELPTETTHLETDTTEEPEPRSYSLSGIGAGFGFGALTATTEATGVPEASPSEPEDRIVIDATDEVTLSDVETLQDDPVSEAIPEDPAPEQSVDDEPVLEAATASDEPASDDAADLKPRTRFNPWT